MKPAEWGVLAAYYACLLLLAVYGTHRLAIVYLYFRNRKRAPRPAARLERLPRVTVQLPIYNERYVVSRLLDAVCAIDYPRELLEIQVLDDSSDETRDVARRKVEEWRARGWDIVYLHRDARRGFKAGALAEGLARARGEYLLVLDADFLPHPRILRESLDHFADPRVGMVQSRWDHVNREYSLLTRVQAILLDGHFVIEHTARSRSGRFFNFNGTAGIWRRRAIEDAGGWQGDTLTEDLDLSYRAQLRGWRFVYLKDLASPAELPVDINAFKIQQHRWAKGSIQTGLKVLPRVLASREPWKVKVEALFHLTSNFSYPLIVALSLLVYPAMAIRHRQGWRHYLWLDAALFLVSTVSVLAFYVASQKELGGRWAARLRHLPMLMWLGIGLAVHNSGAVFSALAGRRHEFRRTPKYSIAGRSEEWRGRTYRARLPASFAVEIGLTLYLAAAIALSLTERMYLALPFLLLFFNGYAYVVLVTLAQRFPLARRAGRMAGQEATAF